MGKRVVGKRWPAPGSRISLGLAILYIVLALGQAVDALDATTASSAVLHIVVGSILLVGSAYYFLLWRKGRH